MTLHTNEEKQTSVSVPDCEEVLMMNYLFIKELDNRTAIIFKRKKCKCKQGGGNIWPLIHAGRHKITRPTFANKFNGLSQTS